jgi:hypothetical protein
MKILDRVEIVEPYPAIWIKEIDSLVIADLHLGYEGIMAEEGIFIPKVQFEEELEMLEQIIEKVKASRIIIDGDVKHEFSETSYHEFIEVRDLFLFLKGRFKEVIVIKGNHDNFIIRVTKRYGVKLYDHLLLKGFLFLHGHKIPKNYSRIKAGYLIIGHEHPAIALFDEIGVKEKIDCFLYGDLKDGKMLIVLPAFSTLMLGSEVNLIPKEELLSPILRELARIEKLKVIGITRELGCLRFPELSKLHR